MNLQFPPVWNLIDSFKERCRLNGWETCETEDLVKTKNGEYHSFLWTQNIKPSTFERIATRHKCGVRRENSYEVVNISYMCWLFQERPPEFLINWIKESPSLAQKTAIFDLSCVYTGENVCRKFNDTNSVVFYEFERFLEEWNLEFKPVNEIPALTP
jgi:hypothetical protein